jgi:hypothetical protein
MLIWRREKIIFEVDLILTDGVWKWSGTNRAELSLQFSYIIKKTIFKFFNLKLRRKITLFNRRCRRSICCCWNRFRISSFRICPFRILRLRSKLSRFRTRFFGEIDRFGLAVRFANRRIFWTVIGRQIWKIFSILNKLSLPP